VRVNESNDVLTRVAQGDWRWHSHRVLGVFDRIARNASAHRRREERATIRPACRRSDRGAQPPVYLSGAGHVAAATLVFEHSGG